MATGSATDLSPGVYNHYGPHRNGLPPLRKYLTELWQRRQFAFELSRANMRASSSDTFFGQIWLVLNPLLMAGVYFLLVAILSNRVASDPRYFPHLTTNLFVFTFVTTCANAGATSVTTAGKLLLNTAFPRLLIPLGAVHTAFFRFIPTLPVTLVIFLVWNKAIGWGPKQLAAIYFLFLMTLFGAGLASFFAAMQVYFRDTSNFLPFFVRVWTYLSPVLWLPMHLEERSGWLQTAAQLNPAYSMLSGYSSLLIYGSFPKLSTWLIATAWAVVTFLAGSLFFMSREREFAVRIY
ncbi:ABC transporter permease [Naumannella sp. ID2617S]|uniref:Transport permease protein n=1 Tax=Enemella dayhoffiae TaxID=2016507 RepID=A0A255HBJ2_9ACTN|nr:ABC transporter permease [Naumannella sp. ID2617S]OYO25378.1 ABC transporter permease [Enemella dayhoffiae]